MPSIGAKKMPVAGLRDLYRPGARPRGFVYSIEPFAQQCADRHAVGHPVMIYNAGVIRIVPPQHERAKWTDIRRLARLRLESLVQFSRYKFVESDAFLNYAHRMRVVRALIRFVAEPFPFHAHPPKP